MLKNIGLITIISLFSLCCIAQDPLKVGDVAPKVKFQQAFSPNYKIPKDKILILDFWATWCPPCLAGLTESNRFLDRYTDKFEFIAITDSSSKNIKQLVKEQKFKHHFVLSKKSMEDGYHVYTIPQAYIVNTKGIIIWSGNSRAIDPELLDQIYATLQLTK